MSDSNIRNVHRRRLLLGSAVLLAAPAVITLANVLTEELERSARSSSADE